MNMKAEKLAADWTKDAVEKCMTDPAYAAEVNSGKWCANCDMEKPCLCDQRQAVRKMREYYEKHRRTLLRAEPKLIGSWNRDMDGLMTGLWTLATQAYRPGSEKYDQLPGEYEQTHKV